MTKSKKILCTVLSAVLALSFAGCGKKEKTKTSAGKLDTVSVFCSRSASLGEEMVDYNDVTSFQEMEALTGVKVNWTLPPSSGYEEKFNLMIASGKFTDVIISDWKTKGAGKYLDDGVIICLNDYEEYMPNFMAYTKAHPEFAKDYMTSDGKILYMPYIREDRELNVFWGPLMRQDWLDKLGLQVPENAEELYNVLKAFKTQDPNGNGQADEIPMSGVSASQVSNLLAMFDTAHDFYVKDGKVVYGIMEKEFDEGISYMAKLFDEELLDSDYVFQDRAKMDGKMTNNKVGFMYSYQPTTISNTMAEKDPNFKLVGIPYFKNKEGKNKTYRSEYIQSVLTSRAAAISTDCKDPAAVIQWLDSFYSEEGIEIMNFGRKGESYEVLDGKNVFTDYVMKNADFNTSRMFGRTSGVFNSYFPSVQKWESYSQSLSPYGKAAIETWSADADTSGILPAISFTYEEKETVQNKLVQIQTYADEKVDKIILGQESVGSLKNIRTELKKMGIDEVLKIYQTAYDRYLNTNISF